MLDDLLHVGVMVYYIYNSVFFPSMACKRYFVFHGGCVLVDEMFLFKLNMLWCGV